MKKRTRSRSPRLPTDSTLSPTPGASAPVRGRRHDPIERVLNLLTLLSRASAPMSREQIVNEMAKGMTPYPTAVDTQRQLFGADKNTISRELGINVRQIIATGDDAGQTRYFIDPADMFVPDLDLTPDETAMLSIALASIQQSVPQAGEAMMKFAGFRQRRRAFGFNVRLTNVVVRLTEATQSHRVVRVVMGDQQLEIQPWRVVFDTGTWYVVANVQGTESRDCELVVLKCSSLRDEVEFLDQMPCCEPIRGVNSDVRALIHQVPGVEFEATVVFDAVGATMSWWHPRITQVQNLEDGGVRITFTFDDPVMLWGWLISFGEHVRIEGPGDVRDGFIAWLEALVEVPDHAPEVPPRPTTESARPGPRPLAERLQRLLSIVPWLHNVESIDVAELAAMVGVNTEHLLMDLEFASMCGVPPYTHDALFEFWVEDGRVYFSGERNVQGRRSKALIPKTVKLTSRQAAAVELALATLATVGFEQPAVATLRAKLAAVVGQSAIDVHIEGAPLLSEVRSAAFSCREIAIEYVNWRGEHSERLLQPRLVFIDRGEAYLKADDLGNGVDDRIFKVDRILSVRETGNTFPSRNVEWTGKWDFRGESQEAVVYLAAGNEWVLDRIAHRSRVVQPDGSVFLWVDVASEIWLATLIARCGAPSCVIEPASMRLVASQHVRRLLALYANARPATSGTSSGPER